MRFLMCSGLLLVMALSVVSGLGQADDGACPGTCGGKWFVDNFIKSSGDHANTDTSVSSACATPSEQTATWKNPGSAGTESLTVTVSDPGINPDHGVASLSKGGWSYSKLVVRWNNGNATPAGCCHGRPDGGSPAATTPDLGKGSVNWGGGGSVTANCGGESDNTWGGVAGSSAASSAADLVVSGLESEKAHADVSGSKTEGANGTLTFNITLVPSGTVSATLTSDVWISNAKTANLTVTGPNPTATPALVSPPDIVGAFLKTQGTVSATATIQTGAHKAWASAATAPSGMFVTPSGGIHSTCCGTKNHGGHGVGTPNPTAAQADPT